MKKRETSRLGPALTALAMLFGLTVPAASGRFGPVTLARAHKPSPPPPRASEECEGDACSQVTVTFDESKQQYRAWNNSAERWARVTASNVAASASACLAPGKDAYLPLKSITGSYHAAYAEERCGEPAASGPPAGE